MKSKTIIVSFIAIFVLAFALNIVAAKDLTGIIDVELVKVNGVELSKASTGEVYIGQVSDTIPVFVQFGSTADVDEQVKVTAYIDDYEVEIEDSTVLRTNLQAGVSGYTARFTLRLPSSLDLEDADMENTKLYIKFKAHGYDSFEEAYTIKMSKDFESLNILSVETSQKVTSGSSLAVDVVIENNGHERLDDVYVKASIPELGISTKVYVGDLASEQDGEYDNIRDTLNKKVYLSLPRNVIPGTYELEVEAYNHDATISESKTIVVEDVDTGIIPGTMSKTIAAGEEATFNVILVNPNNRMVVYTITPETTQGLIVEVAEPIVTVGADSSKTVKVKVKATESIEEGTYAVTVNVNSEAGSVRPVTFTMNVEDTKTSRVTGSTDPVVIWTVVLVIVFVVLLIILIVLLTKRPEENEEFGETSYY